MKFGPVPLEEAENRILGHNVTGANGRRLLRKGKTLTAADVSALRDLDRETVYVAELEAGDVDEDSAAGRIAGAIVGPGLRLAGPSTGRANLYSTGRGLLRVDVSRLLELNQCEGVTLATLAHNTPVSANTVAATLKILPYALPERTVAKAVEVGSAAGPLLSVTPFSGRPVGLILSGAPAAEERVVRTFSSALEDRLEALGTTISRTDYVPLEDGQGERALAEMIGEHLAAGMGLIILAGETAIMDGHDLAPRAIERAGGEVTIYGAPVDPGNLFLLASCSSVPVAGVPGCARSPKRNIVDLVLPRLLAGDRLRRADVIAWGHGGLLEDVPERPAPRSRIS